MNRLRGTVEKLSKLSATELQKPAITVNTTPGKDQYRKFHKTGPELFITRVLMVNGPLTSKELWRIYERTLFENKHKGISEDIEYWPSLTKMKETLKFMRTNEKIGTGGYSYNEHIFKGWKINEKRALKFVHPQIIHEIQQDISKRENL
jgi:hypothetical protein